MLKYDREAEVTFLAGDVGGTKTLLALYDYHGGNLKETRRKRYLSGEHKCLEEIIEDFLKEEKKPPSRCCFAIAGPTEGGVSHTINLQWVVSAEKISKHFNIESTFLINDLVANAWGIRELSSSDLMTLNQGTPLNDGNQGMVSPGTGLGEAVLFYDGKQRIPGASEGGHADFSPRNDQEVELFKYLKGKFGHVSKERVLSGQGIVNLYQFLVDTGRYKPGPAVLERMKNENPAKVITEMGISNENECCQTLLSWFCSLLGAEAGNFALSIMGTGGIFLGGGIVPKIIPELKKGEFMKAFVNKGRLTSLLSSVPVHVILEEDTALKGAAYYCLRTALGEKN